MRKRSFSYILGLWIVFLISFISSSAQAHPPYLEKLAILEDEQGNQYILEKLYGDGVVLADPYRFQIRNLNGAILAHGPANETSYVDCPSLGKCRIYSGSIIPLKARKYSLDISILDPVSHFPQSEERERSEADKKYWERQERDFKRYLEDEKQKSYQGYAYNVDPETSNQKTLGFNEETSISSYVGLVSTVLTQNILILLGVMVLGYCSRLYMGLSGRLKILQNRCLRKALHLLWGVGCLTVFSMALIINLAMMYGGALHFLIYPIMYWLGTYIGKIHEKRKFI